MVLTNIFGIAKPQVLGTAIDDLTLKFQWKTIIYLSLFIVVLAIFQGIFRFIQRWYIIRASRKAEYTLRNDFFACLQDLSMSYYDKTATGDIMIRATSDLQAIRMALGPGLMHAVDTVVVGSFALVMMIAIDWKMTIAVFSVLPMVSLVVYLIGKKSHYYHNIMQESYSELNAFAQENISGVRVVKAFTLEKSHTKKFLSLAVEYFHRNMSLVKVQAMFIPILFFLLGIGVLLVLYLGGSGIIQGKMTIGDFAKFIAYLMMLAWPMIAVGWVVNIFQRAEASMKRVHEIMSTKSEIFDSPEAEPLTDFQPEIEIRDLSFSYNSEKNALDSIDIKIEAGESVGIVGSVGSGKSTIVKLISRLYNSTPDKIFIGGKPIEKLTLESLRRNISFIPQDTFLFSDTIRGNICFGTQIDESEFLKVCGIAGLENDLEDFPEGYDTMVGERGVTLSGGQKQRVSLARALLSKAPILILDDALSAVDASTEAEILKNLREVFKGKTVIVVTHRISAVMDLDRIYVMDEGRIVEQGSHKFLTGKHEMYYRLYKRQLIEQELERI